MYSIQITVVISDLKLSILCFCAALNYIFEIHSKWCGFIKQFLEVLVKTAVSSDNNCVFFCQINVPCLVPFKFLKKNL